MATSAKSNGTFTVHGDTGIVGNLPAVAFSGPPQGSRLEAPTYENVARVDNTLEKLFFAEAAANGELFGRELPIDKVRGVWFQGDEVYGEAAIGCQYDLHQDSDEHVQGTDGFVNEYDTDVHEMREMALEAILCDDVSDVNVVLFSASEFHVFCLDHKGRRCEAKYLIDVLVDPDEDAGEW